MFPNTTLKEFIHPQLLLSDFSIVKNISDKVFSNAIDSAFENNSLVEFMTHPGMADRKGSYLQRYAEFDFLRQGDWKNYLHERKISLVTYDMI